ncbi:MalM family protein [Agarivorans sp. MS3-6]
MRKKIGVVLGATLLGLTACSSGDLLDMSSDTRHLFGNAKQAIVSLEGAPVCCEQLSQLSYQAVTFDYVAEEGIDTNRQAFAFNSGKSFVLAYKLPILNTNVPVKIESIIGETLFAPSVALLDENFQVTRVIPANAFKYKELKGFSGNMLSGTFRVSTEQRSDRVREAYMVVYTTDQSLFESTQIVHPERSRAKAQAKADPGLPDPFIPHSPLGLVNVTFNPDLSKGIFADEAWFGGKNSELQPASVEPVAVQGSNTVQGSNAVGAAVVASSVEPAKKSNNLKKAMLPETEAFYNKLIEDMIKQGEIDKALKLVEEAEYAGSRSARNVFIDAIKNN